MLILLILFAFSVSQCKGDKDPWWIVFPGQSTWSAIAIILFIAFVAGGTYYLCTREEKKKMEKEKKDRRSSKEKSKSKDINLKKLVDKYMKKHKKKEDEDDEEKVGPSSFQTKLDPRFNIFEKKGNKDNKDNKDIKIGELIKKYMRTTSKYQYQYDQHQNQYEDDHDENRYIDITKIVELKLKTSVKSKDKTNEKPFVIESKRKSLARDRKSIAKPKLKTDQQLLIAIATATKKLQTQSPDTTPNLLIPSIYQPIKTDPTKFEISKMEPSKLKLSKSERSKVTIHKSPSTTSTATTRSFRTQDNVNKPKTESQIRIAALLNP